MNTSGLSTVPRHPATPPSGATPRKMLDWTAEDAGAFGVRTVVARHHLHEHPLFSERALRDLIDNYPRDRMQAFTMGSDLMKRDDWQPVDIGDASSSEIFAAVARGRLWFKLLQMHVIDSRYKDAIDSLYAELASLKPGFEAVRTYGTLLISSPTALVYYHADPQPNMLWHISGSKRVWVYPPGDRKLISQDLMEDIFASYVDEEAPYDPEFDDKAEVVDLTPGYVIAFPQNAPHRVTNLTGVNISLSTLHETAASDRRKNIFCANRLFRRSYHLPLRSVSETGAAASLKQVAYRVWRRFGLLPAPPRRAYVTDLQLDANSPSGMRTLPDGPILTAFSKREYTLVRDPSGNVTPRRIDTTS